MPQYTITFQPGGQQVQVDEGTTLLQAQIMAGLKPDAPCGGHGTCKKCTVRLADGREVLACQTQVHQDETVYPAQAEKAQILTTSSHTALPSPDGSDAYALAIDIGTTTLAAYLLSGKTGAVLTSASSLNPSVNLVLM